MNTALGYYIFFVFLIVIQRLAELFLSKRNEAYLKARGAIEVGHSHFVYMKLLHVIWPIACILEATFRGETPSDRWIAFFFFIFCCGQLLRLLAIATLGKRWTVKILILPGVEPVTGGIFKFIRHPNYLGVILELFALPLMFNSWFTAITFTLLNAWLLKVRIAKEEIALNEGNRYNQFFATKNRFVPGGQRHGHS